MKKSCYLLVCVFSCVCGQEMDADLQREYQGKIEVLEHDVTVLKEELAKIKTILYEKTAAVEEEKHQESLLKDKTDAQVAEEMETLIEHKEFDKAQDLANAFLKKNPQSIYCGMIMCYLGDCFFERQDYNQAAESYMDSYKTNKKGSKAPQALYNLALCFEKLKKLDKAKMILEKISSDYSGSSYASKANKEIKRIGK